MNTSNNSSGKPKQQQQQQQQQTASKPSTPKPAAAPNTPKVAAAPHKPTESVPIAPANQQQRSSKPVEQVAKSPNSSNMPAKFHQQLHTQSLTTAGSSAVAVGSIAAAVGSSAVAAGSSAEASAAEGGDKSKADLRKERREKQVSILCF